MSYILNKTDHPGERYRIIEEGMGYADDPDYSPCYKYQVVAGMADKDGEYPCAWSMLAFLTGHRSIKEAKDNCIQFLIDHGYYRWLYEKNLISSVIRLCPQGDGTCRFSAWNYENEDYVEITPFAALKLLAKNGTFVEVAVNDPHDKLSHWESKAKMEKI